MDASASIDLGERHYPERLVVFKPIWEYLYAGIESEKIISVDYVRIELEKRADSWRKKFLNQSTKMFLITQNIEEHFAQVVHDIETGAQFPQNSHRDRFMSGADPWLIALARNYGHDCTVVSGETKALSSYGLGTVCEELAVRHIGLVEYFEENKIGQN